MSARLFIDDILFFQRMLKAEGLYKKTLDGDWGPNTEAAAQAFMQQSEQIKFSTGSFDIRSEACISTLALASQKQARLFLVRLQNDGVNASSLAHVPMLNKIHSTGRGGLATLATSSQKQEVAKATTTSAWLGTLVSSPQ